jgi:flavin-dependent dehydrogenase
MPDVVIVGAGPAGASLAVWLGRAGYEVVLIDKARFPRDKACGEGLMPSGVAVLQQLGLDDMLEAGAPFEGVRYHAHGRQAAGRFPTLDGMPAFGLGQRRLHLDERLIAVVRGTPGVTLLEGVRAKQLLKQGDRTVGLEAGGEQWNAKLVVLADGLHSPMRRAAGLDGEAVPRPRLGLRAHYRLAEGQSVGTWVEVYLGDRRRELYVTPLPNRELLVAALVDQQTVDGRPAAAFEAWVHAEPDLAGRLEGATAISPVIGMAPLEVRPRAGVAPGLVLLGDAAGFIDPITGGGMAQALLSARLLATHIPIALAGPDGGALIGFDRARNRLLRDYRLLTRLVLQLADHPPLARAAVRLLASQPALFSHLLGVSSGGKPIWRLW